MTAATWEERAKAGDGQFAIALALLALRDELADLSDVLKALIKAQREP